MPLSNFTLLGVNQSFTMNVQKQENTRCVPTTAKLGLGLFLELSPTPHPPLSPTDYVKKTKVLVT